MVVFLFFNKIFIAIHNVRTCCYLKMQSLSRRLYCSLHLELMTLIMKVLLKL